MAGGPKGRALSLAAGRCADRVDTGIVRHTVLLQAASRTSTVNADLDRRVSDPVTGGVRTDLAFRVDARAAESGAAGVLGAEVAIITFVVAAAAAERGGAIVLATVAVGAVSGAALEGFCAAVAIDSQGLAGRRVAVVAGLAVTGLAAGGFAGESINGTDQAAGAGGLKPCVTDPTAITRGGLREREARAALSRALHACRGLAHRALGWCARKGAADGRPGAVLDLSSVRAGAVLAIAGLCELQSVALGRFAEQGVVCVLTVRRGQTDIGRAHVVVITVETLGATFTRTIAAVAVTAVVRGALLCGTAGIPIDAFGLA